MYYLPHNTANNQGGSVLVVAMALAHGPVLVLGHRKDWTRCWTCWFFGWQRRYDDDLKPLFLKAYWVRSVSYETCGDMLGVGGCCLPVLPMPQ